WREHVEAMRANGLRVEGASGDRTVRVNATADAADAGPCELVIIATKARDVKAAAVSARRLVVADTVVLSIQNGLGGPDLAASASRSAWWAASARRCAGRGTRITTAGSSSASANSPGR